MARSFSLTAATLATALLAVPAFAQTGATTGATAGATTTAPAPSSAASVPLPHAAAAVPARPVAATVNPADAAEVRTSKVVGATVYNDHNDKIGSVDDLVVGKDGKLQAVLSVGGFLGAGAKLVSVPYSELKVADNTASHVTLPNATKDSLKGMAAFHFAHS